MKAKWVEIATGYFYPKSEPEEKLRKLKGLLDMSSPHLLAQELKRIRSAPISNTPETLSEDYDATLLQAFVARSVEQRDSQAFTSTVISNCPVYIGFLPMEYYLAGEWHEGFVFLFDSYEQTHRKEVKQSLLYSLGHAFESIRRRFPDDDEFVAQARRWYVTHQLKLQRNPRYAYLAGQPAVSNEERGDLFEIENE